MKENFNFKYSINLLKRFKPHIGLLPKGKEILIKEILKLNPICEIPQKKKISVCNARILVITMIVTFSSEIEDYLKKLDSSPIKFLGYEKAVMFLGKLHLVIDKDNDSFWMYDDIDKRLNEYQKLLIYGDTKNYFMETILFAPDEYVPEIFLFFLYYDKYSNSENDVYEISLKKNL